jgi:hypothetical protein
VQRQVWVFLTQADEDALVAHLAAQVPVRRLSGRFFRGSLEQLRTNPEGLETSQLRRGEKWTHLLHPIVSRELVTHPVTEGPFAGWSRLDEVRSEVITIVRPELEPQGMAPARVQASTHSWFGGTKHRKSPEFSRWVNDTLKFVQTEFPPTAFDWIHVAPGARELAKSGGRLHYLYREVGLTPPSGETPVTRPHKGR